MKTLKYITALIVGLLLLSNCTDDEMDYTIKIEDPTNVSATVTITQDNSGLVTILPIGEGVARYSIDYGDDSEMLLDISPGNYGNHVYEEGTYNSTITALGLSGVTVEVIVPIVVSFNAPENLVVTIENDPAISKQVNVTATADFAMSFDVYFGEDPDAEPVSANIGETAIFNYAEAGIYMIRVVAKGGAIETTEYTEEFEVTEILNPLVSAPDQPARQESDYISIFSDAYTDIADTDFNPNWGQSTVYTEYDLDGDAMLQYSNLNYQGIDIGSALNASSMEMLHVDIWTTDATSIDIYPLPDGVAPDDERFVTKTLVLNEWNSFDIPLTDFSDQGLPLDNLKQFKFVGSGSVFIDNLYFFKAASDCDAEVAENIDPAMGNINWTFMTNDIAHTFEPFGNIASAIVPNPVSDGVNSSCNVQQYTKTANCETWSGVGKALATPIDLITNTDRVFTMKVLAEDHPTEVTLRLEFEPYPDTEPSAELVQTMSGIGAWEELTFDFSAHADKTFKSVIVYFDRNNPCDEAVYYFDDIIQVGGGITPPPSGEIMDFEPGSVEYTWTGFGASDFTSIPANVISNPDPSGINTSVNVVEIEKLSGAQTWAGASTNLAGSADFTSSTTIDVKVWSPRANTPILFKMEDSTSPLDGNGNPTVFLEVIVNSTLVSTWETVSFDLTTDGSFSTSISYDRVILFPDFNSPGLGEKFYFDDITVMVTGGGTPPPSGSAPYNPINFEAGGYGADWTWSVFENVSNPPVEIIANPDPSGINTSSTVAKITALVGGQPWVGCETLHGADIGSFSFDATNSTVKIMVWKSVISDVGLKFAEASGDAQPEVKVANTLINQWEELTFDLSGSIGVGATGIVDQLIVFPDFDLGGRTTDNVVYFDNITFGN